MKDEYYLGLDIGTQSVGWAVTDTKYNINKFKQNAMWGIRLFDESQTAAERRAFRSSRRRTQRKRERLQLLEMLFDGEISKVDVSFFQRLRESNLYFEDKSTGNTNCVFADKNYTDKDYHKDYPTVYHLRNELITNPNPHDVRLVFIALHHIVKNKGHFLFDSLESVNDFSNVYNDMERYVNDNYDLALCCNDINEFSNVLKDKRLGKTKKNTKIADLFKITKKDKQAYSCLSLLSGSSVKFCDIFNDESLNDAEKKSISFASGYDDNIAEYQTLLGERFELIEKFKAIYDWAVLADILNGKKYISQAKIETYNQHNADLKGLKEYVKKYAPDDYNNIFNVSSKDANYVSYSGHFKKGTIESNCTQEDFCDYIRKTLGEIQDIKYADMFLRIENKTFMPKQTTKDNGVIPMQIHRQELMAILDNAKEYLPFLNSKDADGKSVYDKIISLFDYRIPYYVGPLNTHSKNSWIVRSEQKIYPWNFGEVVDLDKSAEQFINNLTSKCTYLPEYDVIPKNSVLYSKYMVLNELNNLKIDGNEIDVQLKQRIFNDLFLKYNKVTNKKLRDYLISNGYKFESITGIDNDFKSSMKSMIAFSSIDLPTEDIENIIHDITIFGDDKKLLKKRLRNTYSSKLSENELLKLFKIRCSGWSSLSKEFLTNVEATYKPTGEVINIITALWQTNMNLMQLLYSEDFDPIFNDAVKQMNRFDNGKTIQEMVENLYVSPKVKRPIYQSILIAKEIEKIEKCPPKKIFVEVAKGEEKKERKASRKQKLLDLYKDCKKQNEELYESLLGEEEDKLRQDKLYLYYTQFGKCMYSGKAIDLGDLMGANSTYDIDHIYPRSKIKDDSLDNRVLVNKTINANKTNDYPLSSDIRNKMGAFWSMLLAKDLISKKKYDRLVRATPLTDDELYSFISRQIVETRQSTKAVANILEQLYPDTEIVYVKAALASDFRHTFKMLKCREVNDLHHAKDAYLNIVVGNVYNEKFTHNKRNFIQGLQQSGSNGFSLNRMYDFNVKNAWVADNKESLTIVKKYMNKNNILYTRYAFKQKGGLFDQLIVKKGSGQVPIKLNSSRSDIEKYGGYNRPSSKYFALVEYSGKKGKQIRQLVPIDAYSEKDYLANPNAFTSQIVGYDATVIILCIKYNACLSFNGFRMHLSSKSGGGATLVYKPGVQLALGYEKEKYIKNIQKYLSEYANRPINQYDHITAEENIELYQVLTDKMTKTIFKEKFFDLGNKLSSKQDIFTSLSMEKQCYVLSEILKILHANVVSGDLSYIGEAKKSGISTTNSKISDIKNITSVKLINQSITGLFEQQVELLK